jgi:hypothetical protein
MLAHKERKHEHNDQYSRSGTDHHGGAGAASRQRRADLLQAIEQALNDLLVLKITTVSEPSTSTAKAQHHGQAA